jgi:glycosyltransferase involved in cell wall biosynthesis
MKILQVGKLYYPWVGGVEKIVQQITEGLNNKDGFEIEVLCCQPKGEGEIEKVNGVKIFRASSFGIFWGLPLSFNFFRLFKKLSKKADIIDFHHPFPLGDISLFLFKPKAKIILHYHSDIVRQKVFNFLVEPFINHALKNAEKIIVSNPNLIKSSPYLQKFQGKCKVIPFGVDLPKFEKFNEREVENLKKKYNDFVLFVGRLNYYKGLEYLIEAIKEIKNNLVIIGEGPLGEQLKNKVQELGIKDKVFFLPLMEEKELVNFYRASTVFVLPSIFKSEAFGIVLIEAMACEKPVISTDLGTGTSFVNQDGITGFVVPPGNAKALSRAIKKILENKKIAKEFGQNGRKRAESEFSLKKMLERVSAVYKDLPC